MSVSLKSASATRGMRWLDRIIIFTSRDVSVMTVTRVTSEPVPAVVGTAMSGTPGSGILW